MDRLKESKPTSESGMYLFFERMGKFGLLLLVRSSSLCLLPSVRIIVAVVLIPSDRHVLILKLCSTIFILIRYNDG